MPKNLESQTLLLISSSIMMKIKLSEISYGFPVLPTDGIPGYWDSKLNWHEGVFKSQYWMIENFIQEIQKRIIQIDSYQWKILK